MRACMCRRTKSAASLDTFQQGSDASCTDLAYEPGLNSHSLGSQPVPHKSSGQSEKGINNANSRRAAAFRHACLMCPLDRLQLPDIAC